MLFSARQAVTQASQPVHLSRSTAIPQRCLAAKSFLRAFAGGAAEQNETLVGAANPRDLDACRRPRERAGFRNHRRRENRGGIHAAMARVAREVRVPLAG